MSHYHMSITCPRCGRDFRVAQGESSVTCNCHLYCSGGTKPSDCTLVDPSSATYDAWNRTYNWPQGMHLKHSTEGDDVQHQVKYCTTHDKYVYKVPFLIDVDQKAWMGRRARPRHRFHRGDL